MGLFHKKSKKEESLDLPELPELPSLPELPENQENSSKTIHQLPSFPNNSLGDKFSQDTIKEAITGRKEDDEEEIVDDFEPSQMIQSPLKTQVREQPNLPKEIVKEAEPLFVRLDKFKESHEILDDVKKQMHDINHLLSDTNHIKEKEDEQLKKWETELQNIKNKVEKIDQDLFSKL